MSTNQQKQVDIPLDEYIAKMNITSKPPNPPQFSEANSERSTNAHPIIHSNSYGREATKPGATTPRSSLIQSSRPKITFRNRNPDLHRDEPVHHRHPYNHSSANLDARDRIQQLRNRRRHGQRFFFEREEQSSGPSRPSITPPSSMQRQAVVMSGPSWEQMLPVEQLQQMATSACFLSAFFNLPAPPPFNDPALFRQ